MVMLLGFAVLMAVGLVLIVLFAVGNYRRSDRAEVKARERCLVRTGRCLHNSHYR